MNVLFELLFNAWCAPYDPRQVPEHLRGDPVKAYGQYAFQEGFRLGLGLAVGIIATTKLLEHLMQVHPRATYLIILGFVVASIPTIFPGVPAGVEWIACLLTLLAGFGVVFKVSQL